LLATLKGGVKGVPIAPAHSTTGTGNAVKTEKLMSMSTSLGSKDSTAFGKTTSSKRNKKKKDKTKNIMNNYDDDGVGVAL